MDINMLGPEEAYHDQIYQGSQGPPSVHGGAPRHNPYTPQGLYKGFNYFIVNILILRFVALDDEKDEIVTAKQNIRSVK